jgi:DNA (cytosine-5)-methyltransferase 1
VYFVGYSTKPGRNWRGVFPIGGSDGKDNVQRIKVVGDRGTGGQQGLIYGDDGIAPCLNAHSFADPMKIKENIKIKSATKQGYEVAQEGDSINLSNPNSDTRRGRVGKGKAQTLDTGANQAVVQPVQIGQSTKTFAHKSGTLIGKEGQDAFTIRSSNPNGVKDQSYRIRRLTPIECERLQGFPDNHTEYGIYDGEVKKMSNTQRYKQCGNAVTVDIVALVAEAVKPLFK